MVRWREMVWGKRRHEKEKRDRHHVKMLYIRVQKARCLQLTSWDREKRGGSRPITPHLLLPFPLDYRSGAQLASSVLHLFPSSFSQSFCPHPSKNSSCPFIFHHFSNPQSSSFLPFPTQVMSTQWQISRLYSSATSLHLSPTQLSCSHSLFSPSSTVTDLCLFSFHVLPPSCAPLRTCPLSLHEHALVTQCLCAYVHACHSVLFVFPYM